MTTQLKTYRICYPFSSVTATILKLWSCYFLEDFNRLGILLCYTISCLHVCYLHAVGRIKWLKYLCDVNSVWVCITNARPDKQSRWTCVLTHLEHGNFLSFLESVSYIQFINIIQCLIILWTGTKCNYKIIYTEVKNFMSMYIINNTYSVLFNS